MNHCIRDCRLTSPLQSRFSDSNFGAAGRGSGNVTLCPFSPPYDVWPRLLPQQVAGDDDAHDLVGAFEDLVHPQIAQIALDREILEIAVAAMQLQRLVGDMKTGIGGEALGHRAL